MPNVPAGKKLSEIERSFFEQRATGFPRSTSTNNLKKRYWNSLGLTGDFADLERKWLRKIITDNSQTPSNTLYVSTLLSQALSALGIAPGKSQDENFIRLYKNYNP